MLTIIHHATGGLRDHFLFGEGGLFWQVPCVPSWFFI